MNRRHLVSTIALALGIMSTGASPALAQTEFDGDLVEVTTDRTVYSKLNPIRVRARYSNFGNSDQVVDDNGQTRGLIMGLS